MARSTARPALVVLAVAALTGSTIPAAAAPSQMRGHDTARSPGAVSRVSVSRTGEQADRGSGLQDTVPALSAHGRYVTFVSAASNLVPDDTNGVEDVFVRDRRTGRVTRASVGEGGRQADDGSVDPSISADGRLVAFTSAARNLVTGDTNGVRDVFVRDLRRGTTRRVSVGTGGRPGDADSFFPVLSADGSAVAFQSFARLSSRDTNNAEDIYVRDLRRGRTWRASLAPGLRQFTGPSALPALSADGRRVAFVAEYLEPNHFEVWVHDRRTHRTRLVSVRQVITEDNSVGRPSLSADGRFVAFASSRTTLVPGDTNQARDVFVRDLRTGRFRRVSVDSRGGQGNSGSEAPSISAGGRYVAFASHATNLVASDSNDRSDVFLRDLATGALRRVPMPDSGGEANDHSAFFNELSVSADGRHVAFESVATNLVPADTNRRPDVFVWDARKRRATRPAVGMEG
jgi:Tol biopolymer transport system component